jgi:hypothetical protein
MANAQLQLITMDDDELWKLDSRTIRIGRKGLAQARAALARSRKDDEGTEPATPAAA